MAARKNAITVSIYVYQILLTFDPGPPYLNSSTKIQYAKNTTNAILDDAIIDMYDVRTNIDDVTNK